EGPHFRSASLQNVIFAETLQSRGEDVLGDAEAFLEIAEAPDAEEGVTNNQQRPPVAHDFQRSGQRAVQFRKIGLARHGCRVKPIVVWFHSATKTLSQQEEIGK